MFKSVVFIHFIIFIFNLFSSLGICWGFRYWDISGFRISIRISIFILENSYFWVNLMDKFIPYYLQPNDGIINSQTLFNRINTAFHYSFLIAIETFILGQLYLFVTSYLSISSLSFSIYSPLWVYIGDRYSHIYSSHIYSRKLIFWVNLF